MREYLSAVNLKAALVVGSIATIMAIPRIQLSGMPVYLYVPSAFFAMEVFAMAGIFVNPWSLLVTVGAQTLGVAAARSAETEEGSEFANTHQWPEAEKNAHFLGLRRTGLTPGHGGAERGARNRP